VIVGNPVVTGDFASVLELRGISKAFGGVDVVCDVTVEVARGKMTALVGPNGAGKSTLLGIVAGEHRPTSGKVLYRGQDVTSLPAFRHGQLGIVRTFQLPAEFKRLTVLENLLVVAAGQSGHRFRDIFIGRRVHWIEAERVAVARARALLARFGLEAKEDQYAGDLSGGQRRIVEVLRAVMADPVVLLLDEPFAGVHPEMLGELGGFLGGLCAEGATVMLIAHELDAVERHCDSVVVMARGAVIFEGTMTDARRQREVVEAYVAG
jgi:ABC-type branched-subunit amino acid transport system ATPase component